MSLHKKDVFNDTAFERLLSQESKPLFCFQSALEHGRHKIRADHFNNGNPETTVSLHAWLIDKLVIRAWKYHITRLSSPLPITLIAVGGYGRAELHPASDIDLMILAEEFTPDLSKFTETFIQFLWDMGLEVGHSTRTLRECAREAKNDITVATNLMESRLLIGSETLFSQMRKQTDAPKLWPSKKFFQAKLAEQHERHARYGDTAYNLEPNIKEGPGGLRDIQMILWVTQRHFRANTLRSLVDHGFLSKLEYKTLIEGRNFLWSVRNSLHYLADRREDRLLFDHQRMLANHFGYTDNKNGLAVEQFMKHYYRTVKELSVLNEILLQHFDETILSINRLRKKSLNNRFHSVGDYLAVNDDSVFSKHPESILEMFLTLEKNPRLKGVRAQTIRLLRASLSKIDHKFRNKEAHCQLFMDIIRQPRGVTQALRRMNSYGVLAAYIPTFGNVVGQMQHDLFHVYTVDEHSLFVVRNIRRLTVPEYRKELPLASSIMQHLLKPERLYLAGLFHDIAKGRGGDHSELGATDVTEFCQLHKLSDYDTYLISWLVKNHLLMSWTSQHQDISDPNVVNEFSQKVGDQEHLDNLYLLTVADMRGTSPKIWNDWKGHLLLQLYQQASRVFARGIKAEINMDDHLAQRKHGAMELLELNSQQNILIDRFWRSMDNSYFLGYEPNSLAWHARTIITSSAAELPIVATRFNPEIGGNEFLFYLPSKSDVLVKLTGAFDRNNLSIVDARINSSQQGFMLTTFVVLDTNGEPIKNGKVLENLENTFRRELLSTTLVTRAQPRRLSRQLKHFPIATKVSFSKSPNRQMTLMEVIAQDMPGLLYEVTSALYLCKMKLVGAKISTFGERAEDIFFITDQNDQPITDEQSLDELRNLIHARLQSDQEAVRQVNF
ncbi:MAG: [protein-PII] uridylyltransferase [Gammaproteobacteria bacterium]|nr:[protein-PII] uridylyltransferase [Gammaproteobacteria bacterium]